MTKNEKMQRVDDDKNEIGIVNIIKNDSDVDNSDEQRNRIRSGDESEEEELDPLFMDGLPSNFAEHPGLAAIASLIQEEERMEDTTNLQQENNTQTSIAATFSSSGGGKAKSNQRRPFTRKMKSNTSPYPTSTTRTSRENRRTATLGEAQIFLNLWKI